MSDDKGCRSQSFHNGGHRNLSTPLRLWREQNESAKFCLRVLNELLNILIAVVDRLKGSLEATRTSCA